jgi:hypothetical protein
MTAALASPSGTKSTVALLDTPEQNPTCQRKAPADEKRLPAKSTCQQKVFMQLPCGLLPFGCGISWIPSSVPNRIWKFVAEDGALQLHSF